MVTKITTVSLSLEDFEFIQDNKLSTSELIKEKVDEIRAIVDGIVKKNLDDMRIKYQKLNERWEKMRDYMESKNLLGDFYALG